MKILIIHNHWLEEGGEDRVVNSEINLLRNYGHQVVVYIRSNKEFKYLSIRDKIRFFLFDIIWSKKSYDEINDIIGKEKPDIAHIHNIFFMITPSIYYVLRDRKIPIVQTVHNYRFFCPSGIFYRKGKICEECLDGNFIPAILHKCWRNSYILSYFFSNCLAKHFTNNTFKKKIDVYIALSKFSKNKFIEKGLAEERIFIKPNFLEIDKPEMTDDQNFFLFVGRLADYKGVDVLISAFRISGLPLKIIGTGPRYKDMQEKTKSMPNIELIGRLPFERVLEYIRKSYCVIFPSECYENMPRVIIESFACGVPVIASNFGAAEELIEDGLNGFLFEASNSRDLAKKVSLLFDDMRLCERLGIGARTVYEQKFMPDKNYEILMDIYKKAQDIARYSS